MNKARIFSFIAEPGVAELLNAGGVGVIPSDTLYGIVCSALQPDSIERIYALKKRDPAKPCIVLVASLEQLLELEGLDQNTLLNAEKFWPGAVSVVVPCQARYLSSVHRGEKSIACRVPDNPELRSLLEMTGPLLAPSANVEGAKPAANITEAMAYFGASVDFYVDGGEVTSDQPSTLISFDEDGLVTVLRQGAVSIP